MLSELSELLSAEDLDWQNQANCKGSDPNKFFPGKNGSEKAAKIICQDCVVRVECLEYSIKAGEKFGVWGGLGVEARRKLRRERAVAATGINNLHK